MSCFTCNSRDFAGTWWWLVRMMSAETRRGEGCHIILSPAAGDTLPAAGSNQWPEQWPQLGRAWQVTGHWCNRLPGTRDPGPDTTYDLEPSGERNATNTPTTAAPRASRGADVFSTTASWQSLGSLFLTFYFDVIFYTNIQRLQINMKYRLQKLIGA